MEREPANDRSDLGPFQGDRAHFSQRGRPTLRSSPLFSYSDILITMNKGLIYLAATIGGLIGGYLPVLLFHAGNFSVWSILGTLVGGLGGIWAAVKLNNDI